VSAKELKCVSAISQAIKQKTLKYNSRNIFASVEQRTVNRLHVTVFGLAMWRIFSTKVQ
jgi:hypothetical protein